MFSRERGEIDPLLLHRILQEGYAMGLRRVGLYTTGEMFMCKELITHIQSAKDIGYEYIYTDTNGSLASEEKLIDIIQAGVDSIKFSINAGTRETYLSIHGHDDFDKVVKNLKMCHKQKQIINPKLRIMVDITVTQKAEAEVKQLKRLVMPYVDAFISSYVRALPQIGDDTLFHQIKTVEVPAHNISIPCQMVLERVHVTYNGYLTACCADFNHDLLLADLNVMSLQEAWTSSNAINFRRRHVNNEVEGTMCHGCSLGRYIPYAPLDVLNNDKSME